MKLINTLSIASFITFFSISLLLGTLFTSSVFSGIFTKKFDLQTQAKIYNFLQKDKQIVFEMYEKVTATEIPNRVSIIKDYYEKREKLDTSDFPEDFRYAWENKILADVEWAQFLNHLKNFNKNGTIETQAEKEIADKKIAEMREFDHKLITIASRYGIEFDADYNILEKK